MLSLLWGLCLGLGQIAHTVLQYKNITPIVNVWEADIVQKVTTRFQYIHLLLHRARVENTIIVFLAVQSVTISRGN